MNLVKQMNSLLRINWSAKRLLFSSKSNEYLRNICDEDDVSSIVVNFATILSSFFYLTIDQKLMSIEWVDSYSRIFTPNYLTWFSPPFSLTFRFWTSCFLPIAINILWWEYLTTFSFCFIVVVWKDLFVSLAKKKNRMVLWWWSYKIDDHAISIQNRGDVCVC